MRTLRAIPTLVRVGFAESVAYRAEMLVWLLSTTMPLVMLALMTAVAREAPIGRFGQADFTAYYLAALVVRLVTGAWVIWEVNYEIRQGTLAFRLEQSGSLFEVWLGLFGVFSGYLIPLELFPRWLEQGARFLPFRYMLAFPVEMVIGLTPRGVALGELAIQWLFVVLLATAARLAWRAGLRRFAAYGG